MRRDDILDRLPSRLRPFIVGHGDKFMYLVVGAWNTLFGYGLFLFLLATVGEAMRPWAGSTHGFVAWMGVNYYLIVGWAGWVFAVPQSTLTMKFLVFRSTGRALHEVGRAYLVYLPSQWIGTGLLWFFVAVAGLSPQFGALAATGLQVIFSYLGHKHFTFGKSRRVAPSNPERPVSS